MAGIAGLLDLQRGPAADPPIVAMCDAVAHRGPDGGSVHVEPPVALGHRRLGAGPRQPLASEDATLRLVYDGDLHNRAEVAAELRAHGRRLRDDSEAETVLAALAEWGERAFERFNGTFALALWDRPRRRLLCARDRLGLKPLYYTLAGGRFRFASEQKALLADPLVPRRPNDARVLDYLAHGLADHTPETMLDGILRLPAGSWLVASPEQGVERIERWYRIEAAPLDATPPADAVRELLTDAVALRLRDAAAAGVGLSGGVDSASVLALASRLRRAAGAPPPPSYSARVDDPRLDEWSYAKAVVDATGSRNRQVVPDADALLRELDHLLWLMDEPFHSLSVFGHRQVMELARLGGSDVLLEGQAGDDVFTGVDTWYPAIFYSLIRAGRPARALHEARARAALNGVPVSGSAVDLAKLLVPNALRGRRVPPWLSPGQEIPRRLLPARGLRAQQRYELEVFTLPRNAREVDRNSACFGIRARAPFLDHRVVEYGFALPAEALVRDGWTKAPVRDAMRGIVPREVLERRDKQGFTVDQGGWMRGALGDRIEAAFRSPAARARPYWNTAGVLAALAAHRAGEPRTAELWRAYAVERWLELVVDPELPSAPAAPATAPWAAPTEAREAVAALAVSGAESS